MKKVILLCCLSLLVSACTTLSSSSPFRYVPSLNSSQQSVSTLGIYKFVDVRPANDQSATKNILDLDEKVTAKVIEDFRSSRMFLQLVFLLFPARMI